MAATTPRATIAREAIVARYLSVAGGSSYHIDPAATLVQRRPEGRELEDPPNDTVFLFYRTPTLAPAQPTERARFTTGQQELAIRFAALGVLRSDDQPSRSEKLEQDMRRWLLEGETFGDTITRLDIEEVTISPESWQREAGSIATGIVLVTFAAHIHEEF